MAVAYLVLVRPLHGMDAFALDRTGLIFCSLALPIVIWAVLGTRSFLRLLGRRQKDELTRGELAVIRVPGTVVIFGIVWIILITLLYHK